MGRVIVSIMRMIYQYLRNTRSKGFLLMDYHLGLSSFLWDEDRVFAVAVSIVTMKFSIRFF